MIDTKRLETILNKVEKPARYIGCEMNTLGGRFEEAEVRFAFAFPDVYEVGMSHMGTQILYYLTNSVEGFCCERCYVPWPDMEEQMRSVGIPLYSLESKEPLSDFDIVGFTLQYELSYTNILNMLDLGGIPLTSAERLESDPLIIAGGSCGYNPEPLWEVIDLFIMGEGESVNLELFELYRQFKREKRSKEEFLKAATEIEGIYVPGLYDVEYNPDGTIRGRIKKYERAPSVVRKRIVEDFDRGFHLEKQIIPLIEVVHDRAVSEIFRGCTEGCRFCQAGMIYRPVRERSVENIVESTRRVLESTGFNEVSLSSLSTCDYPEIRSLVSKMMADYERENVSLSLPSLRLDSESLDVLEEIQKVKKTGLTFAPEAGSQRLRNVINKNISEKDLEHAIAYAFQHGYASIKLYFMLGLPTETMEDVMGIKEISYKIKNMFFDQPKESRKGNLRITSSASCFVPKPFTPFQWVSQNTPEEFHAKIEVLRHSIRDPKVKFSYHEPEASFLEGVFARGDRRLSSVLITAFKKGCKFDGWSDHFDFEKWQESFREEGIDPSFYTARERERDEILPWDFVDVGVTKDFLYREYEEALEEKVSPDCRNQCYGCGVNHKFKGKYCP